VRGQASARQRHLNLVGEQMVVGRSRRESRTGRRRRALYEARLDRLIEDATIDTYNESEQRTGFHAALAGHLQLPFETMVLGVPVLVVRIDQNDAEEIVRLFPFSDYLFRHRPHQARNGSRPTVGGRGGDRTRWRGKLRPPMNSFSGSP
jgi:hypothetical protein